MGLKHGGVSLRRIAESPVGVGATCRTMDGGRILKGCMTHGFGIFS